ncbi:MAG: T9SS type A sorting domain-containing protein [Bacteroidetes bacterium]|nr:T9SS type A sorting domain-containing protein [Bacteroidota bacterium]
MRIRVFFALYSLLGVVVGSLHAQQPIVCEPIRFFNPAGMEYVYSTSMPTPWWGVRMTVDAISDIDTAFIAFGVNRGSASGPVPDTLDVRILKDRLPQQIIDDNMTVMIPPNIQGKVPDAYYIVEFAFNSPVARITPNGDFWLAWRLRGPTGDQARIRLKGPALNPRRSVIIHTNGDTTLVRDHVAAQLGLSPSDSVDLWAEVRVCYPYGKPVELTAFSAAYRKGQALLEWRTATEDNNMGFEVLRLASSQNADPLRLWERIGFVEGNGTTGTPHTYHFADAHPDEAIREDGIVRYRLRQIDYDGTTSYSPVVEIRVPRADGFQMEQNYPNPASLSLGETTVALFLPAAQDVHLTLFDALGRYVRTVTEGHYSAGRHFITLPLADLRQGTYFYRCTVNGRILVRRMSVVQ